jgi:hypothetical protein
VPAARSASIRASGRAEPSFGTSPGVLVGGVVGLVPAEAIAPVVGDAAVFGVVALATVVGDDVATLFTILAEHTTNAPPPLAEALHWLIVMGNADDIVPVTVQVKPTRVPPLAVPSH